MMEKELLTAAEVATELKISRRLVDALIKSGVLPAEKIGEDWLIKPSDLKLLEDSTPNRSRKNLNEHRTSAQPKVRRR